jgi:PPOX class probable F420-dependent enzyme
VTPHQEDLWQLVAGRQQAVLATIKRDGRPQLSNVLYTADADTRVVRISTTADRIKARNLARDPRGALHVAGDDFWHYAVAEGVAALSAVSTVPADEAGRELLAVHSHFYGELDPDVFFAEMVANRRLVIRFRVEHLYGVMTTSGHRPVATS